MTLSPETLFNYQNRVFHYENIGKFEEIESGLAHCGVRFAIPRSLSRQLRFDDLTWQSIVSNHFPLLLIGGTDNNASVIDALATIRISQEKDKKLASRLEIAGINDQKKLIAVDYNLKDFNNIARLNISLSDKEITNLNKYSHDKTGINLLTFNIPPRNGEEIAGFVTPAMYKKAGIKSQGIPETAKALAFKFQSNNIIKGKLEVFSERLNVYLLFKNLGYYIFEENGFMKIGFDPDNAKEEGYSPWQIDIEKTAGK